MAYVKRDISNNIIAKSDAPNEDYTYIDDNDQEYLDWIAAQEAQQALEQSFGFKTKEHENYAKLLLMELAKKHKDDELQPPLLRAKSQDYFDNVT